MGRQFIPRRPVPGLRGLRDLSVVEGVIASGSTLTWMIAGLPDSCAALNAGAKSAVFATVKPKPPNARAWPEIGVVQRGRDDAPGMVALLVHADGAVHAVVDDDDHDRQFLLHGGRELLPGHHEIAIAAECHHGSFRLSRFMATAEGRPSPSSRIRREQGAVLR